MITPPDKNSAIQQDAKSGSRRCGLDIVRTIACASVIGSHFFLYTDFNKTAFDSPEMFFQGMLSSIIIGSDLYMMLTGFLCMNKTFGKKFYFSGIKVLASYLFFSILTIILGIYLSNNGMTWRKGILGIFSFSTIPYAWYIEMWIGLFIMAPFLNIWYKALPTRRMKQWLILILFLLTAPPDFLNRYDMYLWPQFWKGIYPVMFYFIGCYVHEYSPKFDRRVLGMLILAILLVGPVFNTVVSHPTYLHIIGGRSGIFIGPLAILIFLCFYDMNISGKFGKELFKSISLRSLDIFLCSATLDALIYPWFRAHVFINQSQYLKWYFVIIPTIFIIAFGIASAKRILFCGADRLIAPLNLGFRLQNVADKGLS